MFHIRILSEHDMLRDLCSSFMSLLPLLMRGRPNSKLFSPERVLAPVQNPSFESDFWSLFLVSEGLSIPRLASPQGISETYRWNFIPGLNYSPSKYLSQFYWRFLSMPLLANISAWESWMARPSFLMKFLPMDLVPQLRESTVNTPSSSKTKEARMVQ